MAVALPAAALIATVPGLALWRGSLQSTMATTRTGGISTRGGRLEGGLVVAQIALAVLLVGGRGPAAPHASRTCAASIRDWT